MTYSDLVFFNIWDQLNDVKGLKFGELLATYPTVEKHFKGIAEEPRVKAYVAKRP